MLKKVQNYFKNNPDKKTHFIVGACITLSASVILGLFMPALPAILIGIILAAIAGVYKEVKDLVTGTGTPEMLDFAFTAIGGIVAGVPLFVIYYLIKLIF